MLLTPICTIPIAHSSCLDVSHGIPVVIFCHCGCVTYHLNRFYILVAHAVVVVHQEVHAFHLFAYSQTNLSWVDIFSAYILLLHLGYLFYIDQVVFQFL